MSDELKPCPFCGGTTIGTVFTDGYKWGAAECGECLAKGPEVRTGYDQSEKAKWRAEAIAEWNRRAENAELRAKLEEIRKLAECGASHGLLADDYCSKILDVIAAPVAPKPEQAIVRAAAAIGEKMP